MAPKSKTPPKKPSKSAPAKKKPAAAPPKSSDKPKTVESGGMKGARKLGERKETITELLSPMQTEAEARSVVTLLREIERAEEELKNATAGHKAKISDLRTRLKDHARASGTGKRDKEVTIEEWLTPQNEVIRIRADTRERIGNRNATTTDLQEPLPGMDAPPPPPEPDDEENLDEEPDHDEETEAELEAEGEGDDPAADDADVPPAEFVPTGDEVIDELRRRRDARKAGEPEPAGDDFGGE